MVFSQLETYVGIMDTDLQLRVRMHVCSIRHPKSQAVLKLMGKAWCKYTLSRQESASFSLQGDNYSNPHTISAVTS